MPIRTIRVGRGEPLDIASFARHGPTGRVRFSPVQVEQIARTAAGAPDVFDSPCGELLIHEPSFLAWFLGLSGRAKPRAARRAARRLIAPTGIDKAPARQS